MPPHLKCVVTERDKLSQRFNDRVIGQRRRRLNWVRRPAARRTHWTLDVQTARCV